MYIINNFITLYETCDNVISEPTITPTIKLSDVEKGSYSFSELCEHYDKYGLIGLDIE